MADVFGDEGEGSVTLSEYIEDIEAAELAADMVLGGDEGEDCTYPRGYMKRQAIFSCLTCVPGGDAGVCTACCLTCHDGHEIVELWTKRNFRCDCGNSKFANSSCKLFASKDSENLENNYNQNFRGLYCTCHRPYPDPEAEEQVDMIQCCMCEDWFHGNHIGLEPSEEVPTDEEQEPLYEDFICPECAITVSFLKLYPPSIWVSSNQKSTIPSIEEKKTCENAAGCKSSVEVASLLSKSSEALTDFIYPSVGASSVTVAISSEDETSVKKINLEGHDKCSKNKVPGNCLLELGLDQTTDIPEKKMPFFLSKGWRDCLCKCQSCCEVYAKNGVHHLIDKDDSMEEYVEMAKQKRQENLQKQETAQMDFMNTLGHVQKIEVLNGISNIRNEISSFLVNRGDSSKTVTAADVQVIVENLAKKRRLL